MCIHGASYPSLSVPEKPIPDRTIPTVVGDRRDGLHSSYLDRYGSRCVFLHWLLQTAASRHQGSRAIVMMIVL